jgi:hypothetical protein
MQDTALATDETIDYIAAEVIDERLRFSTPSD